MSEMLRRHATPPAADHERHDAMLVAQFVAGDPLAPEQQGRAQRQIAECGACAQLAADLRAVSVMVAGEPVPPRRRDFRLSPDQAEELRGNAFSRLLRRLSLPSARAFQPAAAGVLSVGLLFVVAGYVWPEGGTVVVQAEPNVASYPAVTAGAAPADEPVELPVAGEGLDDLTVVADEAARSQPDPEFLETLPEHQAGTADGLDRKAAASEAEEPETAALDTLAEEQVAAAAAPAAAAPSPAADGALVQSADTDIAPTEALGSTAETGAEDAAQEGEFRREAAAQVPQPAATDATSSVSAEPGAGIADAGPGELLVALGASLALAGVVLLALGWLARRSRDPLLP